MKARWKVPAALLLSAAGLLFFWPRVTAAFGALPLAWADAPGHVSYTLIAVSYWLTDIFWLRVTAVVGLFFEILYFRFSGGNMQAGIGWDVVFILINLYQLYRLVAERRLLGKVQDLHLLKQGVFSGLEDAQLARLVPSGRWRNFEAGSALAREGERVGQLALICSGEADVAVRGEDVARIAGGSFVGEMAFATGQPASATVTAARPVRAFVFEMDALRRLVDEDESVASALHTVIGRDLAAKLRRRNRSEAD